MSDQNGTGRQNLHIPDPHWVKWVQIDLGEDAEDADHLISPEECFRIAMARQ